MSGRHGGAPSGGETPRLTALMFKWVFSPVIFLSGDILDGEFPHWLVFPFAGLLIGGSSNWWVPSLLGLLTSGSSHCWVFSWYNSLVLISEDCGVRCLDSVYKVPWKSDENQHETSKRTMFN